MLYELAELAETHPDQPALRWLLQTPVVWTYGEFARRAAGVATLLLDRDLPAAATIAVIGGNHPAWVLLREACAWLGYTFVPIGPRLAPGERDFLIRNCSADLVLGAPDLPPGGMPVESWAWCEIVEAESFPPKPPAATAHQLLYTSGSSGKPKGVLRARGSDDARIRQSIAAYGIRPEQRNLVAGPLYHSGPAIFFRIFCRLGARQTILPRFSAATTAELVCGGQVDTLFMVPTMWRMLLDELRLRKDRPTLQIAWIAGSKTDPELRAELLDVLGDGVLWEFYGSTETGTVSILPPDKQRSHGQTVGFPLADMDIRIVDEDGAVLPAGQTGRVYVRSPTTMTRYHRGPGSDPGLKEDMLDGGWVSVGDTGYVTTDGALILHGREKGMIISGGINVYPEEVEAALKTMDGVLEAVAFGVADATWGQKICAVVEPRPGVSLTAEQLTANLRDRLAGFKIPKQIQIVPIPRTASEKVVRDTEILEKLLV